jgi:hypothetical protein
MNDNIENNKESPNNSSISSNKKNIFNKKFTELKLLSEYYSKLHFVSYVHLKFINNIYIIIMAIGSFSSGALTLANSQNKNNSNYELYFGIADILIALFLLIYKQLKLPENLQSHYNYFNQFRLLNSKLNTIVLNIKIENEKNKYEIIRDMFNSFNDLISQSPSYPTYIIYKYNLEKFSSINNMDNGLILDIGNNVSSFRNANINIIDEDKDIEKGGFSSNSDESTISKMMFNLIKEYLKEKRKLKNSKSEEINLKDVKKTIKLIKDIQYEDIGDIKITEYDPYTKKKKEKKLEKMVNNELMELRTLEKKIKRRTIDIKENNNRIIIYRSTSTRLKKSPLQNINNLSPTFETELSSMNINNDIINDENNDIINDENNDIINDENNDIINDENNDIINNENLDNISIDSYNCFQDIMQSYNMKEDDINNLKYFLCTIDKTNKKKFNKNELF